MKNLGFLFIILLSGCLTTQKAINKLENEHMLAQVCSQKFPCTISGFDSTDFKKAVAYYDSLYKANNLRIDSFQIPYDTIQLVNTIDSLVKELKKKPKYITLPPIHDQILDSSGKQALREQIIRLSDSNEKLVKNFIDEQNKYNDEKKSKGNWMKSALWTWGILLLIIIVYVYARYLKK